MNKVKWKIEKQISGFIQIIYYFLEQQMLNYSVQVPYNLFCPFSQDKEKSQFYNWINKI